MIVDPDKATVVGVQVQAKHIANGAVYKTESTRTGAFTFSELPAGTYELYVPATGFTFAPYAKKEGPLRKLPIRAEDVLDCELKDTNYIENDVLPLVEQDNGAVNHNASSAFR